MPSVFVIRGFGLKKDSKDNVIDFDDVHAKLIQPAMDRCSLVGGTTATVQDAGNIRADMFELIIQADLVICDITVHNANVFYELGIRHSLRKKHTVLIKGSPSADTTPFDLSTDKYLKYDVADPESSVDRLVSTIEASLSSIRDTDSPVFLLLPTLSEADPAEITATPFELIEAIERAEAASDIAQLSVIAGGLQGERFENQGIRRVGRSQFSLKDFDGAQISWEKIKKDLPDDSEANSALANIYERQYRNAGSEVLLKKSNQCIEKVLDSAHCTIAERAEALAQEGRNLKTLWRVGIDDFSDVDTARKQGINSNALKAYESYRAAFECDLNAFYPGLAALQMGHILRLLSKQPGWKNLFNGRQREANRFLEDLDDDLPAFTHVVRAAIKRAQLKMDDDLVWANVAEADLLLLTLLDEDSDENADTDLLVGAYRTAIPQNKQFAWDASIGQLELFLQIGFNPKTVQAVIEALKGTRQ